MMKQAWSVLKQPRAIFGVTAVVVALMVVVCLLTPHSVGAVAIDPQRVSNVPSGTNGDDLFKKLLNATYAVIGFIAVIVIIIAGFRYITSDGDSTKTASAKNAIIYAVVGLVIMGLAFIITGIVQNIANA